ncbi:MAG: ferredoxin family protein [Candidatus Gygaella obscura]|nr:ferredoxin family protein [Candidatus Gygaella obscura]
MAKIKINNELCKGCGLCVLYCPKGLIRRSNKLNKKGYRYAEFKKQKGIDCVGCMFCAIMCPESAIEIFK